MQKKDSLEKTLMLGKIKGGKRRGQQRVRWLDAITETIDMSLSRLRELTMDRKAWHAATHGVAKSCSRFSNWTEWKGSSKNDKRFSRISQHLSNSWENWLSYWNWVLWVLPFPGSLLLLTLILTYDPCLMLFFSKFLQHPLQAFTNRTIQKLLLTHSDYQKLQPHTNPFDPHPSLFLFHPMMPLSHRKQLWKIDLWPLS